MYRALIADDEPWVIYSLQHLINWEEQGFTICGTADNGDEALEKCLSLKADVLISDIRMPGLSGIELLTRLQEAAPDIEVIFVSGYSSFEYTQKAIQLGAADYLLKQVTAKDLLEACKGLKAKLDEKKQRRTDMDIYTFLALMDEDERVSIAEWIRQKRVSQVYESYRMINFAGELPARHLGEVCYVFKTGRDKFTALVGYSCGQQLKSFLRMLGTCKTGISRKGDTNALFLDLYKEADIAFYTALMAHKGCVTYKKEADKETVQEIVRLLSTIETSFNQGDRALYLIHLGKLSRICENLLLDRVAQVHNALSMIFKLENETPGYRQLALEYNCIGDMFEFFRQCLSEDGEQRPLFQIIMQYIDEHYTEDLRLSSVAEEFHFAHNYFSTMFKKMAGVSFTKYIADKRMTLAKTLLKNSSLTLQEIVERVGYNDYFQFIKTFKRETGTTPGQYRRS